ncbi:MAG: TonB family protein [Myxococcales bacterium]|nr:TonB family protein [Myxococcales bacterium]MCB9537827.1 TonB family protein [Myxococcales bacterium]
MAQGRDRKILRIGIIQNGKIIEERLLRKRESVTIGQSPRNTFVLPSSGIPKSATLFELKGGVYTLNFRPQMSGKVSVEDAVLDFKALREQNLAKKRGDHYALPLSEKSRGKVVVDDVTLLFQFVTPPPPPSKLQLPASVRQGWLKGLDWPFVSIMLGSFVFQVFSVAFMVTRDYPEPPRGIEALPDRFVKMIVEPPEAKTPPPEKDSEEKKDEEGDIKEEVVEKKPEPKPEPKPQPKPEPEDKPEVAKGPEDPAAKEARLRKIKEEVASKTILKQLGSMGGEGPGGLVDSLKEGAVDVKMAEAFDGASGVVVADRDTKARDRRGRAKAGAGKVAGLQDGDLKAKGGGPVDTGSKGKEVSVKGTVAVKKPSEAFGTGVLDSSAIAKVVSRRKGAIKSCYEKQLKRNPKLAGKVKVQFTILQSGRVSNARVLEDTTGDPAVGKCIVSGMARWRFPKPDGGDVTVAFPFVFAPSG